MSTKSAIWVYTFENTVQVMCQKKEINLWECHYTSFGTSLNLNLCGGYLSSHKMIYL